MSQFYKYKNTNGEIVATGTCPDADLHFQNEDGFTVKEGQCDDATQYWDGERLAIRPIMNLDVSAETIKVDELFTINNIPSGTEVNYPNGSEIVDDGEVEWSTEVAGRFYFIFNNFPYQSESVVINASE
tara:strand:- start:1671 stop:2057 length:387 start_codon:yes stop_codon:yes gene_type:complete